MRRPALALAIALAGARAAQGAESTVTLSAASHAAGVLEVGQHLANRSFLVDDASSLTFVVVSPVVLAVSVMTPDGSTVTAANAGMHFAEFQQFSLATRPEFPLPGLGTGEHELIVFSAPQPGTYQLVLDAGAPVTERVPFVITMLPVSTVRVGLSIPEPEITTGNGVAITAFVFDGTAPVTGATVTAAVTLDISGSSAEPPAPQNVTLLDDGTGTDDAAGDGIYTGVFTPPSAGRYMAVARVNGTSALGKPFRRNATAVFQVSDATANIDFNGFSAVAIDDNANGLADRLQLVVRFDITTAGKYNLGLVFRAGNGRTMAGNAVAMLGSGSQTIAVNFPASLVRSLGVDATNDNPYTIALIRLEELGAAARFLRFQAVDVVRLGGVTLSQFERGAIELTGAATGSGVDADADGLFDRLHVTIGVDLLAGAEFEWSARLVDPSGKEIGFDHQKDTLGPGVQTIQLDFDGCTIGANGASGPYRVQDLLMFGGGTSLVAGTTIASLDFHAGQFACHPIVSTTTTTSTSTTSSSSTTSTTTSTSSSTTSTSTTSSTTSSSTSTTSSSTTTTSTTTSTSNSSTTSSTTSTTTSTSTTSTTPSTSTTSTSSPTTSSTLPSSTTTSTTLPPCATLTGFERARCQVNLLLESPLCPPGEIGAALERHLKKGIGKAKNSLGKAEGARSARIRNKRLAAADRSLGQVVKQVDKAAQKPRGGTVAPGCQRRLDGELGKLRQTVSGLRT